MSFLLPLLLASSKIPFFFFLSPENIRKKRRPERGSEWEGRFFDLEMDFFVLFFHFFFFFFCLFVLGKMDHVDPRPAPPRLFFPIFSFFSLRVSGFVHIRQGKEGGQAKGRIVIFFLWLFTFGWAAQQQEADFVASVLERLVRGRPQLGYRWRWEGFEPV